MENFKFIKKNKTGFLPETAGVYCFKKGRALIYIGKAVNLRNRIKQHHDLIKMSEKIGYIGTDSEIEALVLEANLIKKHQPKFNVAWRDDKNYFYVALTKEDFPRIFITHQPKSDRSLISTVGPFVDGRALKETLKIVRKVFPYRTCSRMPRKSCLWYQLRRCPAPCLLQSKLAQQISRGQTLDKIKKVYLRNIEKMLKLLKNGKTKLLEEMTDEMKKFSRRKKFEEAGRIRDQIASLERVLSHAPVLERSPLAGPQSGKRMEAYDIANIQGKEATGAMVVFIGNEVAKSEYRQFRIRIEQKPNDIAMLREVLSRRLRHGEWPYPDSILIDGGRAQFNIAKKVCSEFGLDRIKVMSLAKKENKLYLEGRKSPVLLESLPRETFNLILRIRDEAHRFAQRYHHKLRRKALLG